MSYNEIIQHGTQYFPFGLYVVDPGHPKYEMAFHYHVNMEMIWIKSGNLSISLDNRKYEACPGDMFVVNSGVIHGAVPHDCKYECIVFNLEFLKGKIPDINGMIDRLLSLELVLQEKVENKEVKHEIEKFFKVLRVGDESHRVMAIAESLLIISMMISKGLYETKIETNSRITDLKKASKLKVALKFIRTNYSKDLTLDMMACEVGYSKKYFCRFFREMTNKTPIAYLNSYRLERACRLLLSTDKQITEIAIDCGFKDISYFIKTFKIEKGKTPTDYRRSFDSH